MITYQDLAGAFQARHLAVPMEQAYSVSPDQRAAVARVELEDLHFDQAPVLDHGQLVGFVLTHRLRTGTDRVIKEVMSPIEPHTIVSGDASVSSLLEWIEQPGMLFVVEGQGFSGFITVSDFNKQPARAYLYVMLATLEVRLAELIREQFRPKQEGVLDLLPVDAANEIHAMYEADVADNVEADVVAYLTFGNLVNVIAKSSPLRAALQQPSRRAWERTTGKLVDLRNAVMHPTRSLVSGKAGLMQLRGLEADLRRHLEALDAADRETAR